MSFLANPGNIKRRKNKLIKEIGILMVLICGTFMISISLFPPVIDYQYLIRSENEQNMDTIQKLDTTEICLIDKFYVPKNSITEFVKRLNYNRSFIKSLSGFIKSDAYEKRDSEGNLTIITVAVWRNQNYLNNAKKSVQAEFKRINFEPTEFYQQLDVKLERDLYSILQD